jgi:hypothetical protein
VVLVLRQNPFQQTLAKGLQCEPEGPHVVVLYTTLAPNRVMLEEMLDPALNGQTLVLLSEGGVE